MQLRDELLDLALRLVGREGKQPVPVLRREYPHEDSDPADVEAAVGEHLEQDRVAPRSPSHTDPTECLTLGEVQDTRGIHEHRRAGVPGIETPEVHLRDVGDERRLGPARLAGDVSWPGEELIVGE
jgi:hypothetical protein